MIYKDRIYGKIKLEEPIILELINAPTLQRLRGIQQAGYFQPHFPEAANISRFEHSLGLLILLRKFGACLEEQIAGLIHDVSHGAFSHCLDYALDSGSEKRQDLQDKIFEKFIEKTEIFKILKKYGLSADFILNDQNFPLKEKPLPSLCGDRIDYSFRDAFTVKIITLKDINYFLSSLLIRNNLWVFKNFKSAKKFAGFYLKMNRLYYAGLPSALMFRTVGDYLKYALQSGYISESDLYTTDKEVLKKINQHLRQDNKLKLLWKRVNNKVKFKVDSKNFNAHVFCKSRVVDPLFLEGGRIRRISQVDKEWVRVVKAESLPKEYFIKFER